MTRFSIIMILGLTFLNSCSSGVSFEKFEELSQKHCDCIKNLSGMEEHKNACKAEYDAWAVENTRLAEQINEVAPDDNELMDQYHQKQNEHTECHMAAIKVLMEKDGQ